MQEQPDLSHETANNEHLEQGDIIEKLQQEVDEWKDLAARRAAEVENIRRRTNQEKEQLSRYASELILSKLLPVIDDLHNAVEVADKTGDIDSLKTGLTMIYSKTIKILEDTGVTIIHGTEGDVFDVNRHEALVHVPSAVEEGHIVQYVQRGYMLHDRVLRHAKVITSSGMPSEEGHVEQSA